MKHVSVGFVCGPACEHLQLEVLHLRRRVMHQRRELRALHRRREMESIAVRRGQAMALDRYYRTPRLLERARRFVVALFNRLRHFATWGE